jgi:GNAT superfamily N-acetyltransferase
MPEPTEGRRALTFHPLTPDRWDDLEALFGERGACGGCWCMFWRLTRSQYDAGKGEPNRRALREIVGSGRVPGILAYAGDEPVGWCAVEPREAYPALERSRTLKPVDERPVWSVTCFFVARPYRRRGVTPALLRAAVEHVRASGGRVVEGYPVEPKAESVPAAFAWTGFAAAFTGAGFTECARRSPTRPIMRYEIG